MDFGAEAGIFLMYAVGLMIIYFFGRALIMPIKILLKLMLNSVIGGAVLLMVNIIGPSVGITVPLNLLTAVITGVLGVPGAAGLVIYFNGFA